MRRVVTVAIAGLHFEVTVSQRDGNVWMAYGESADREIAAMDRSVDGAVDRWLAYAAEGSVMYRQAA